MPALSGTGITPIIIDVPANGRAIVTVHNDGAHAVLYQVTALDWQVVDGVDQYAVTQDFIASPPLFTLAPSASQVVRVGFRNPVQRPLEQAYRLVLAEVPQMGAAPEAAGTVNLALQYLLPVFVAPSSRAEPRPLTWSLHADNDTIVVRASNAGARRRVLNMVGLSDLPGAAPVPEFMIRQRVTVLANSWREWRFNLPAGHANRSWRLLALYSGSDAVEVVSDALARSAPPR